MSNSSLAVVKRLSPNCNSPRNHAIDTITIHEVWGEFSAEEICNMFIPTSRQASSNYVIGLDGRIGISVNESDRAWTSGSWENDNRAVTIECSNSRTYPNAVNKYAYESLIKLCADICKRNGKTKAVWCGTLAKTNARKFASNEMRMTVHRWFQNTDCPGDWIIGHMYEICERINDLLGQEIKLPKAPFMAEVKISDLNIRKKASASSASKGYIEKGCYRITSTKDGYGWVKGKGYIFLGDESYAKAHELPFKAKIKITDLNIRAKASTDSKVIGTMAKGTYEVTNIQNHWGYIPGVRGWIYISEPTWVQIVK